jgi:hypothetical protein
MCTEFNFDEDWSEDIRRRISVYILVETDALAAHISVVTFLAFLARNLVIWRFQLDNPKIRFERFMEN